MQGKNNNGCQKSFIFDLNVYNLPVSYLNVTYINIQFIYIFKIKKIILYDTFFLNDI